MIRTALLAVALLSACAPSAAPPPAPIAAATPFAPSATIRYGKAPSQRIELFLPPGRGPHPAVVFIHGGCWTAGRFELDSYRPTFAALSRRGLVVWAVGYRRLNEPGGPYPGLYRDVARATDLLRRDARRHAIDLKRVVFAGHSAGGHLALWNAARPRLPRSSPLFTANPLRPRAVVNIAGPGDLAGGERADAVCGAQTYARLTGLGVPGRADPLADTSPARLQPTGVPIIQFVGSADKVVAPTVVQAFGTAAAAAGADISTRVLPGASHRDPVDQGTPAFAAVADAIAAAANRSP